MKKKKCVLIIVSLIFALIFVGVLTIFVVARLNYYYYLETRPDSQPNTIWYSEDGNIAIHIDENGKGRIFFNRKDSVEECYYVSEFGKKAHVFSLEAVEKGRMGLYPEEHYEIWRYLTVRKNTFTITVEKTKFLKAGQEIVFSKKAKTGDSHVSY